jgi:hypothetical protein
MLSVVLGYLESTDYRSRALGRWSGWEWEVREAKAVPPTWACSFFDPNQETTSPVTNSDKLAILVCG